MISKRQQHSREYKIEAVRLVMNIGKSVAAVAGELGIRADQLNRWKREFSQNAEEAFRGNGVMRSEDDEIARLRRELKRVTDERDFSKKHGGVLCQGKSRVASATVVRAANLFGGLEECEVPGVHEHLLAKGLKTLVYAGEFRPTRIIPWTNGKTRIFLYIVSGNGVVCVDNVSAQAGPGDFFVIPKGARHAASARSAKLRAVYFEDRT